MGRETRHHANKVWDENTAYFSRADARLLLVSLVKSTVQGAGIILGLPVEKDPTAN